MTEPLGRSAVLRLFLRSFAIQGSWNYRTLLGSGFAFTLLPALRRIYVGRPDELRAAVQRHSGLFNGHPYLAPMAVGAVARMEAEGEDPLLVERFKAAVRGSLGTLGDRLVWAGWRPVCLLLAIALLLAGLPGWAAVAVFLVVYNAGHLALRGWALRIGLEEGKRVGERLRRSRIAQWQGHIGVAGGFLTGLLLPLAASGGAVPGALPLGWVLAATVASALGLRFGPRVRRPAVLALTGFALLGLLLSTVP